MLLPRVIPDSVDDLREPGSSQLRLVLPAAVETQLSGRQGGRQKSPPDELHQPMGHLLNHFLGQGIDSHAWSPCMDRHRSYATAWVNPYFEIVLSLPGVLLRLFHVARFLCGLQEGTNTGNISSRRDFSFYSFHSQSIGCCWRGSTLKTWLDDLFNWPAPAPTCTSDIHPMITVTHL